MWWTGWGILAFVIVCVPAILGQEAWGESGQSVGTIVGGILLWFIGNYMNRDVLYVHPKGNEYLPRNRHTFYSIPVQYLSVPVVLWGIGAWIFWVFRLLPE
ncbi:hypothetical protein OIE63_23000 [Streptomyces sp. NBC_01795]|uniref:hypothetical protein n=1 Tax=unclassified Streptomyces TaxID=2593676 RepID=UPI002DD81CE6|nr:MULTISPECIES: hypothetical protein [unclassified Streptomyces]WSA94130.1 hypothetical protein OIE63_23000 [Streptomyces sp. NBC_01795]WSB78556.1 hypothetical protein OHB04_24135 [Streptomyces sp. NBC_01775]WSS13245.1 hypothetical protein OG533_16115 [Streptomyces sp. NBC_01186]